MEILIGRFLAREFWPQPQAKPGNPCTVRPDTNTRLSRSSLPDHWHGHVRSCVEQTFRRRPPRSLLDELPIRATLAAWQHRPDAPRCMSGSQPVIAARPLRTSYSPCRRLLGGLVGRSWRSIGTRASAAPWAARRIADLGLGLDRQRVITGGAMLGSAQRQPNSGSTTTSAGSQSRMRLSASPRPALPAP